MNTGKIIKTEDGKYRVYCSKIEEYRDSIDCKKCSRFKKIDPAICAVICREQK